MVCLLLSVSAGTRAAHWTVNPHAWQFDMTAYVQLTVADQSAYEVAAFCQGECRGVGKLLTAADGTQVFQLRIRSNEATGETIGFCIYKTADDEERWAEETLTFVQQTMQGTPGEPLLLTAALQKPGDVNGDGSTDSGDVMAVYNAMAGNGDDTLMRLADVNGDGSIDSGDVMAIYGIMAGN